MKQVILFGVLLLFAAPHILFAAAPNNNNTNSLPVDNGIGGFVPCSGSGCSACNLVSMANDILTWLIGVMLVIFAVLVVVAGFGLVTSGGNTSALESAKSKLTNAIIGLVIVLASFILVDTVMKGLLKGVGGTLEGGYGPWAEIKCAKQVVSILPTREGNDLTYDTGAKGISSLLPKTVPTGDTYTQEEAEEELKKGFNISSTGKCTTKDNPKCTSLEGVQIRTIKALRQLQDNVGETLTITGGTETGHANTQVSHGNGYKIDLRTDAHLNDYIKNNFTPVNGRTDLYQDAAGNIYYRHGGVTHDHWDVTIVKSGMGAGE